MIIKRLLFGSFLVPLFIVNFLKKTSEFRSQNEEARGLALSEAMPKALRCAISEGFRPATELLHH